MQPNKLKSWLIAARLRTLPLAFAGPFAGSCMAYAGQGFRWTVAIGSIVTTLLLQVLSNFANDYGDFVKGTDRNRKGPPRALQSNLITVSEMKFAIYVVSMLALVSGGILVFFWAAHLPLWLRTLFFLLGLSAIYAAVKYTVGEKPYGYHGWGDAVVFLFFGLVSTMGTFVLHTGIFHPIIMFPAISMGLLSTAVLNINNIRDYNEDMQHNKKTIAVFLGLHKAKIYHLVLIAIAWVLLLFPVILNYHSPWQLLFVVILPFFARGVLQVFRHSDASELNYELRRLALSTFLLALLWGIGQII
ncbi:MAG: 1,4-dihydroxy-2-naphthoate octaprenyltransferase [Bacteroidales bacterium]